MLELQNYVESLFEKVQTWRRDFHHYAESGWVEFRTATIVAEELDRLGYSLKLGKEVICSDARMGVPAREILRQHELRAIEQGAVARWLPHFSGGYCGIVATLATGRPGRVMAFRVDMDALDLPESHADDHLPFRENFASCNQGMMHACGHDGHTAVGLGLAHTLKYFQSHLRGTIKLIFQPAEEGVRGAKSMVEAGVVDDVDYFTAIHLGTGVPAGEIVCGLNSFLATTKFDVNFTGLAAHAGSCPEQGKNALLAAIQATQGLHQLVQHSAGIARVNVGVLRAGSGRNIVPDHALIQVETRGETNEVNDMIFAAAVRVISGAAQMYDVAYDLQLMGAARCATPSMQWVSNISRIASEMGIFDSVVNHKPESVGSEDAIYMLERVIHQGGQASYIVFGCDLAAGHHNGKFDFDEKVLSSAIHVLSRMVLDKSLATSY